MARPPIERLQKLAGLTVPVAAERPRRAIPDSLAESRGEEGAQCSLDAEDDKYDLIVGAAVVWIGPNEVQMDVPVPLTAFGPCGPILNLDDVVDATLAIAVVG